MSLLSQFAKMSLTLTEAGLATAETAFRTAQRALEGVTGAGDPPRRDSAPVAAPINLDESLADLANRTLRTIHLTPPSPAAIPDAVQLWLRSAWASFRYADAGSALTLPLRVPLAIGTLFTDASIKGLKTAEVVGASRTLEFFRYCIEIFSEFPVYATLEYREMIARHEKWLAGHPEDSARQMVLGRALVKTGRYKDAVLHLTEAARSSSDAAIQSTAWHEAAVASYYSGAYETAIRQDSAALDANPDNAPARYWGWLAAQRLGGYPEWVPAANRMEMKTGWGHTALQYEEISQRVGLDKTSGGRGIAIFDYNNDGLLDVAVACAHGGLSLYRNNGDGTFTDVSGESGVYWGTNGFGISAGDYLNSGYPALCVVRMGFFGGMVELWRNNGDGTFTDVSVESGVSCWSPSFTCSWCDYDRDGSLDLFICSNSGGIFDRRIPHRLFHNNGDGTFTEVAAQAGIASRWPAIGHSWGDYNNDGYPDLFISNTIGEPQLFRNNGDGTFTDITAQSGLNVPVLAFNAQFVDIDDDGWLDIVQYTWGPHEDTVYSMRFGDTAPNGHPTRVFRNNRDGTFTLISRELGLTECWGSMSGNTADLNNDGQQEIGLGNGGPLVDRIEPVVIYERSGGQFQNVTYSAGLPPVGKGHGLNFADLFNDGRLIMLCAVGGAFPGDLSTMSVFAPKRRTGNYLGVWLTGTKSNRGAIGARLKLTAGGRSQYRVVNNGSNFGCLPPQQHFGLGELTSVEELEVWWPSGLTERFEDLPVNTRVFVTEGEGRFTTSVTRTVLSSNQPLNIPHIV